VASRVTSVAADGDVGVVVVHFHDPAGAITATRCAGQDSATAVVVVDNGSTPRERQALEDARLTLVGEGAERGFAAGANDGIRAVAHRPWILLLNQDVVLDPDALAHLLDEGRRIATVGALAPMLRTPTGQVWSAGARLDPWRSAIVAQHFGQTPDGVAAVTVDSPFVTFAAVLLRTEALRSVGLLTEDLHLYWEDVELSGRLRAGGWGTVVARAATGVHRRGDHGDPLRNLSPVMLEHETRSRLRYARATASRLQLLATVAWTVPHVAHRIALLARARHPSWRQQLRALTRGLVAGLRDGRPALDAPALGPPPSP
jgi:N-acetylglucosaminyl-diphospho-decaprenol L-rhamnosyltransferase